MKMMVKVFACAVCTCLLGLTLLACGQSDRPPSEGSGSSSVDPFIYTSEAEGEYATGIHHATVQVKGYPAFTIELDANAAPVTVANFCDLANRGYYDGLTFYRIEKDLIMQGGTLGNNPKGKDETLTPIIGEFQVNSVDNPLADAFKRGYVAMLRSDNLNSATSTFFITLGEPDQVAIRLSGKYAAFGIIDEQDMQTVDQIAADHIQYVDGDMESITDESHMPIIESIKITD